MDEFLVKNIIYLKKFRYTAEIWRLVLMRVHTRRGIDVLKKAVRFPEQPLENAFIFLFRVLL